MISPPTSSMLPPSSATAESREGLQTLQGLCLRAAREAPSREAFLKRLGEILQLVVNPDALVRIAISTDRKLSLDGLLYPASGLSEELKASFLKQGEVAVQQQSTQATRIGRPSNGLLLAVPVLLESGCCEALAAVFTAPPATVDVLVAVLEVVVTQLTLFDVRSAARQQDEAAETAAAILDLVGRLSAAANVNTAAQRLVEELALYLDGPTVSLLRPQGKKLRVMATSSQMYHDEETLELLIAAGDETIIRGEPCIWPARTATTRHGLLTLRQLAHNVGAASVVTLPLVDDANRLQGALVITGTAELIDPEDGTRFLRVAASPLANCLSTLVRAERAGWMRWIESAVRFFRSKRGWIALVGAGLIAGLMMVPFPYQIICDCELQPMVRRYIAAPFEGRLESSGVEPGDVVSAGQVLVKLDDREIRWELDGVQADLHRALKERDGHFAAGEYGKADIARLESERLRLKSDLLAHRGSRLEITSPIDGIVVSGDLRKTEGAPVTVGQTLFEIAPLDRIAIEILIPEREIAYVAEGTPVDVVLEAFPDRHWEAAIVRLHPRAQLKNDHLVFVAEIEIANEYVLLRPGMQGRATLTTPSRPLGWNLFHHVWERLIIWSGF